MKTIRRIQKKRQLLKGGWEDKEKEHWEKEWWNSKKNEQSPEVDQRYKKDGHHAKELYQAKDQKGDSHESNKGKKGKVNQYMKHQLIGKNHERSKANIDQSGSQAQGKVGRSRNNRKQYDSNDDEETSNWSNSEIREVNKKDIVYNLQQEISRL